jgi:hypothetical protein
MSNWSRVWFYALAACAAVSLSGAGTATAASLPGIAIKAPLVEKDVLAVGYRGRPDRFASDYEYYSYYWPSPPPRERYYRRSYDYDRSYGYSYDYPDYNDYDYDNDDDYDYARWRSYAEDPDRYYGTRAPVEAYERDEHWTWLPPAQPRSCGEYHYWTGSACVDARHFKPYVGPKW